MDTKLQPNRARMLSYYGAVALLALAGLALTVVAPVVMGVRAPSERLVHGEGGVVDLRGEFQKDGNQVYALGGEWEFYPNHFYTNQDFARGITGAPQVVGFPHVWTKDGMSPRGYGTYRMRVRVPQGVDEIGVFSQYQYTAYRIFLNDYPAAQAGRLDPSFGGFVMGFLAQGGYATGRGGQGKDNEYNVIIQVQNGVHASPGLRGTVVFSGIAQISALQSMLNALHGLITGWIAVLLLYFWAVFMSHPDRLEYFDYTVVSCTMLYTVLTFSAGPMSPYRFVPGNPILTDRVVLHLDYFLPLAGAFFSGRQTLRQVLPRPLVSTLYWGVGLAAAFCVLAPPGILTRFQFPYAILMVLLWFVPAVIHIGQIIRKPGCTVDVALDFVNMLIVALAAIMYLLQVNFWHSLNVFTLGITAHLALKFVVFLRHYKQLEGDLQELNRSLEVKIAERTRSLETMTRQAEEARRLAEEASRYKSDFLAKMSHEIRTPLNTIIGMSDLMRTSNFDSTQRRYFSDITHMSHTLLGLINDILDFSKIEMGKVELKPVHYNLRLLFDNLTSMYRFLAEGKSLLFRAFFAPDTAAVVYGDETRVRQICANLLNNAVKYTHEGFVEFNMGAEERAGPDGVRRRYIVVAVGDSGVGIKEDDLERLFVSFERLDMGKNQGIPGSGLGLVITRQLLEKMGGFITVESVYEGGSIFSAFIPLVEGDPAKVEQIMEKGAFVQAASDDIRVLVVDDLEVNLSVALGYLARHGIRADTAKSGREALLKASGQAYDLIFMDHMMPDMDGLEAVKRIRAMEGWCKTVPIVAFSANAVQGARELFLASGMDDFISKPVRPEELNRALRRWLPPEKIRIGRREISATQPEDEAPSPPSTGDGLVGELTAIGFDVDKSLTFLGDMDILIESLKQLNTEYDTYTGSLMEAFKSRDWKNFAVYAHGIKGVFALLGKDDLSETARKLEFAGKEGRVSEIEATTGPFLEALAAFKEKLRSLSIFT
ncbi:MAG: response regulator [Spirochaetaceae bacterium]|jgi:signal transduction histidine kinase/CheY-like chemotaxis protein/HPt (histidine-containing phosphotransfer) domain-containing protein|nr:response regulator [Spirochaetaceae bacterium]